MEQGIRGEFKEFLKNQRTVILPKDLIVHLFEDYEKLRLLEGPRDWMARKAGEKIAIVFMDSFKRKIKLEEIPGILEEIYMFTGMGNVRCSLKGNEIILEFLDSPLFRSSLEPEKILRPFLGVVEGFISKILENKVKGEVKGKSYIIKVMK